MALTIKQRLVVLMATLCMNLTVVSAGCLENAGEKRNILHAVKQAVLKNEVAIWCHCVTAAQDVYHEYLDICFHRAFFTEAKSIVNCTNIEDFRALINPNDFCKRLKASSTLSRAATLHVPLTPTTTSPTTTTPSSTSNTQYHNSSTKDLHLGICIFSFLVLVMAIIAIFFYFRIHRNVQRFGFRYFRQTDEDDKSEVVQSIEA